MSAKDFSEYTAASIESKDGIDHVRARPGNYLGGNIRNTAFREIVDNGIDEIHRGYGSAVSVTFHTDGSVEVSDDGRGVPFDFDAKERVNGIVKSLGRTMSGSNFSDTLATAGTNGVGASATNAISTRFDVTVFRAGKMYRQNFRKGRPGHFAGDTFDPDADFTRDDHENLKPQTPPKGSPNHGTTIRFTFDDEVTPDDVLDVPYVVELLESTARLTEGMHLTITMPDGTVRTFSGPYGSGALMEFTSGTTPVLTIRGDMEFNRGGKTVPLSYDVSLAPKTGEAAWVSCVNGVVTPEGGSHVTAITNAISDGLTSRRVQGLDRATGEPYPEGEHFAAVTTAVFDIRTPGARLVGQSKEKLRDTSLARALAQEATRQVSLWASSPVNTAALTAWAKAALEHARTTRRVESARAAKQAVASKAGRSTNLALPDKYLPSTVTGRGSGAELFICEGDSALGTTKAALRLVPSGVPAAW